VSSCTFSPNGKFLAAGLNNGDISIYDTATWTRIQVFKGHQKAVTSLAYSPNSQQLLSGSWDNTARLWNSETGLTDLILEGEPNKMRPETLYSEVAFSPTGQQVATASHDKSVRLWDARTGASVFVLTGSAGVFSSFAYSPNGNTIASTGWDETIRIFDTLTGLLVLESGSRDDFIMCLTYSLDGQRIATGSLAGRLQVWEVAATTLELRLKCIEHTHGITSIAFSPDDRWIASSSFDRTVKLWDSRSGALISSFVSHIDCVSCVRFLPTGPYIASASYDRTLRLWEINALRTGFDSHDTADLQFCAAYSPDGQQLITGSQKNPIRQFNANSGEVDFVFPDRLYNIYCLAFSPNGLQLAIGGSEETTVRLWDTHTGAAGHVLGHRGHVDSVEFSPDGRWIASACAEGKVLLWEVGTGQLQAEETIDSGDYGGNTVAYKPGCHQVTSCHGDGAIRLWD
ncbi:HET-E protein, partial [Linnemannia elongata AG-77]